MYELKIGDRIKDNDPRSSHRVLTISEILPNGVAAGDWLDGDSGKTLREVENRAAKILRDEFGVEP